MNTVKFHCLVTPDFSDVRKTVFAPLWEVPRDTINVTRLIAQKAENLQLQSLLPIHGQYGLTENAGHEIAGHEKTGHEFARHDKYRMKIDYITLECAFLLNLKSFVCNASVLTYKET